MSNIIRPPMPPQPATTKLTESEIQKELLTKVLRTMEEGFARQDARADDQEVRLDKIERQVDVAVNDGKDNNLRTTRLEVRFDELERRNESRSERVRQESSTNLKQDAAIAQVIAEQAEAKKRDEKTQTMLSANTALTTKSAQISAEIKTSLAAASKHPAIQALFVAVVTFVTAWLARHS